jgi:GT2 family glycosyltransferase
MITLSITNYNRSELVIDSFTNVLNDDRINEIIILDDFSSIEIYDDLKSRIENLKNTKIKLYRNDSNLGAFLNKKKAVTLSSNDWVILLDSDNIIDTDYLDNISDKRDIKTIYSPSHAVCESPILNYESYIGVVDKEGYKNNISNGRSIWDCVFNTGNYFFNKKRT